MKVLLLHALPLDERMWEPQREALWEYEVVTPNLYRLGPATMELWATAILREVWDEFVAVGASMGGYLALALARLAPERLRGLVLAGARADADTPEKKDDRQATIGMIQQGGAAALWDKMSPLLTEHADAEAAARMEELALEQDPQELMGAIRAIRDREDSTAAVAALEPPLLVAVGEHDPFISVVEGKALAKSAPKGKAVVFEGTGHLPSIEQPERFNEKLLDFLSRVG